MNYNQLYYFYVVASEGSVKKACKRLNLTQPTVSGQIRALEEEIGGDLFKREHRSLRLNDLGASVYDKAERIFSLGEEILSDASQVSSESLRKIRVGVTPSLPNTKVHEFTREAWRKKGVRIEVHFELMDALLERLDEDDLDLVLSDTIVEQSDSKRAVNLGAEKLVCVAQPKMAKKLRKDFPVSLGGVPYVSLARTGQIQTDLDFYLKMNGISPLRKGAVDDARFIKTVIEEEEYFSILPINVVVDSIRDKKLEIVGEVPEVISNIWLITSTVNEAKSEVKGLIHDIFLKKRKNPSVH